MPVSTSPWAGSASPANRVRTRTGPLLSWPSSTRQVPHPRRKLRLTMCFFRNHVFQSEFALPFALGKGKLGLTQGLHLNQASQCSLFCSFLFFALSFAHLAGTRNEQLQQPLGSLILMHMSCAIITSIPRRRPPWKTACHWKLRLDQCQEIRAAARRQGRLHCMQASPIASKGALVVSCYVVAPSVYCYCCMHHHGYTFCSCGLGVHGM